MNIDELERIIRILKQNEVNDFELEENGTKIKLTRGAISANHRDVPIEVRPAIQYINNVQQPAESQGSSHAQETASNLVKVESPIVGTFYRKPSPDAAPFVKEGDHVKKGDTLCIIEAMKLMNEIEAETSGKIVKIHSTEGQVVEYGEVLFLIDPSA